ncbi:tetratricopeptide repeat protein 12 isoform X2 [Clupea harengus]|uniref:Tetratricopeptide repeat protein 12 isoform X2 n=1 Tax=Clupea harengus TaxID=7950 RepID=A0A6P8GQU9_CLUHA|nr:tetratricopeptide repeat protein 12 isoform X2 [Clupea harengus]
MEDIKGFDNFLKNVDEISELVKELSSADTTSHAGAVERADSWLEASKRKECQTGAVNRTVINSNPSAAEVPAAGTGFSSGPGSSQEAFMGILEKDAEERSKRRRSKEEKAKVLKTRGNTAFSQGDYEAAVQFYTEGLQQLRDMLELYTNRAQALIRLQKYAEAITDCEWALKCNEKSVKAYVHMGRARLGLHDYAKARECYEKILEIAPERAAMVKEYLSQVESAERRECEERRAWEECQKVQEEAKSMATAATVTGGLLEILQKLGRPDEMSLYYCGGVELLSHAITDCTGQTIFRLHNGFSVINDNNTIARCLLQKSQEPCAVDLCLAVLKLWKVVCQGNETNQQLLMEWACVRESLVCLLVSSSVAVRRECVTLLILYSHTPHGRSLLTDNLDLHTLVEHLMKCLLSAGESAQDTMVLSVLESLAQEKKFCQQIREDLSSIVSPFTCILRSTSGQNQRMLSLSISVIGRLIHDDVIRKTVSSSHECWEAFLVAMEQWISREYRDALYPLLGLMINLSSDHSPAIQRAVGLLSRLLPQSPAALEAAVQFGVVKKLLKILKAPGQDSTKYSIRALAQCTAGSLDARQQLASMDRRLQVLRRLVCEGDESVAGNAALCLGHCVSVPGVARGLLETDCILLLLRHAAADANADALQRNAAIALARLCQADPQHMVRLRELHGLGILHSCMKLIA